MEFWIAAIVGLAGYGGYLFGSGRDHDGGIGWALLGALLLAVPMGLWMVTGLITYLIWGSGFREADIRFFGVFLLFGVGAWIGGATLGYVMRMRA